MQTPNFKQWLTKISLLFLYNFNDENITEIKDKLKHIISLVKPTKQQVKNLSVKINIYFRVYLPLCSLCLIIH